MHWRFLFFFHHLRSKIRSVLYAELYICTKVTEMWNSKNISRVRVRMLEGIDAVNN